MPARILPFAVSKIPFHRKLTVVTLAITGVALLISLLGFISVQYIYEREKSDDLNRHLARVLASNLGAAIVFEDSQTADSITQSAQNVPSVLLLEARNMEGAAVSSYVEPKLNDAEKAQAFAALTPRELTWRDSIGSFSTPIMVDNEQVGTLVIGYQYRSIGTILHDKLPITALLFFICLGAGLVVSKILKDMVFKPLDRLNSSMEAVRQSGDLAERVKQSGDPDFDKIIINYNAMLGEIETRARELSKAMDELAIAHDNAEKANVAKSAFLANMSHELRTPLNAIIGYAEVLGDDLKAAGMENSVEDVGWIYSSSINLLELINGLLDLSKIEAGRMDVDIHTFDLPKLLSEVKATLLPLAARNNNTLAFSIEDSLSTIESDSTKLRQCLLNLGSNACKFTENGYVQISARREGDDLVLEVSDTGIGIAEDDIARLFQPFVQSDSSTTRRFGGTGLGLALIKRFMEMLGGVVEVNSDLGFGSTFTLRLPLVKDRAATIPQRPSTSNQPNLGGPEPSGAESTTEQIRARKRTKPLALVIDDEPSAVQLLRRLLERNGYECLVAADGHEGLGLAREREPDLVLLDISMPVLDGWKVLDSLATDDNLRAIPTVVISVDDRKRLSLERGASEHLVKPVNTEDLDTILQFYADKRNGDILLVEDDPATARLYENGLSQCGFKVSRAKNGAEAIDMLENKCFGLVVTDLMMPTTDGFELIERIGQIKLSERPPVIVMTGFNFEQQHQEILKDKVESIHLKQGLTPRQLATRITELLDTSTPQVDPASLSPAVQEQRAL